MDTSRTRESETRMAKMGVPVKFCWCIGLRMGCKLIGFAHFAVALCLLLLTVTFARDARALALADDDPDQVFATWHVVAVVVSVLSVTHLMLASTLIVSVFMRSPLGLRMWVWVMVSLAAAALLAEAAAGCAWGLRDSGSDMFLPFLEGLLFFAGLGYCIFTVHCYYLLLMSRIDSGMDRHAVSGLKGEPC